MNDLDDILEIDASIAKQKGPSGIFRLESMLRNDAKPAETESSKVFEPEVMPKKSEKPFFSVHAGSSKFAKSVFVDMYRAFMGKLYEYHAAMKEAAKEAGRNMNGYTDKLLKEMEDWGYFSFKTVFRKLKRLTPIGIGERYLQELYVVITKSVKV